MIKWLKRKWQELKRCRSVLKATWPPFYEARCELERGHPGLHFTYNPAEDIENVRWRD